MSIEQNLLARRAFEQFGLKGGSFAYGIFSVALTIGMFHFLSWVWFPYGALAAILIIYALVLMNNMWWLHKYSKEGRAIKQTSNQTSNQTSKENNIKTKSKREVN